MQELSYFLGTRVFMNYEEGASPHFISCYTDFIAKFGIEDNVLEGWSPKRGIEFLFEWLDLHRSEVMDAWNRYKLKEEPFIILPLE